MQDQGSKQENAQNMTPAERAAVLGGYAPDSRVGMRQGRIPALRALVVGLVALAGCAAVAQDDQLPAATSEQAQVVVDPALLWMVGVFDCVSDWHKVTMGDNGQWTFRRTSAVYTLRANATGSVVTGEYREESSNALPGVDIDDRWEFIGYNALGAVVDYSAATSDGTKIMATGTVSGSLTDLVIRGQDSFSGTIRLADGTSTGWDGGEISVVTPASFLRNWLISIGGGTFQLYHDANCTQRVGPTKQ